MVIETSSPGPRPAATRGASRRAGQRYGAGDERVDGLTQVHGDNPDWSSCRRTICPGWTWFIDGVHFAESCRIVALGIDIDIEGTALQQ
jgi:hypothetical protein